VTSTGTLVASGTNQLRMEVASGKAIWLEASSFAGSAIHLNNGTLIARSPTFNFGTLSGTGSLLYTNGTLLVNSGTLDLGTVNPAGPLGLARCDIMGGTLTSSSGTIGITGHGVTSTAGFTRLQSSIRADLYVHDGARLAGLGALNGHTIRMVGNYGSVGFNMDSGTGSLIFDAPNAFGNVYDVSLVPTGMTVTTGLGGGTIGASSTTLTNRGTVLASTAGKAIHLVDNLQNNGVIEARDGGIVALRYGWTGTGTVNVHDGGVLRLRGLFTPPQMDALNVRGTIEVAGILNNTSVLPIVNPTYQLQLAQAGIIQGGTLSGGAGQALRVTTARSYASSDAATLNALTLERQRAG
jgi:hypothetical protein